MKNLLGLPLRYTGEEAARIFNRPRLFNLYGLLCRKIAVAHKDQTGNRKPPFIELFWMPSYAIRMNALLRGEPGDVWVTVDGSGGHVQVLEDTRNFRKLDVEEEVFEPTISEQDAAVLGRKGLLHYTLRQRRLYKPIVQSVEEITPFWYPVWVLYVPKRRGTKLDLKVLDGNTGRIGGVRVRVAAINALIALSKRNRAAAETVSA